MFPEVDAAFESIREVALDRQWAELRPRARKVDQLAVDPEGLLVLIELKDAQTNDAKVYYSPFQLLQYLWEWHGALESVHADLRDLLNARKEVGLVDHDVPSLKGGIRAVVGLGLDGRTARVKRRYNKVLEIVNCHLPPSVGPIETWKHGTNGPRLVG